jgi:hypothetical protein
MKYSRFEDLPVWQAAIDLARRTYEFTAQEAFRRHAGLRDQLERAALSVSNNIAEGFERRLSLYRARLRWRSPLHALSLGTSSSFLSFEI